MNVVPSEFQCNWYNLSSNSNSIGMRIVDRVGDCAEEVLRDGRGKRNVK